MHTFSPTLINEFTFAPSRSYTCNSLDDGMLRKKYNINFPLLYDHPAARSVLPSLQFGGIANQPFPTMDLGETPRDSGDSNFTITNNLSRFWGKHAVKTGFFSSGTASSSPRATPSTAM